MLARPERSTAQTEATLETSRRFAAEAGHELRTPLTSIGTNLESLSRSTNLAPTSSRSWPTSSGSRGGSSRHPDATITFASPDELTVEGWPDGLRLLVDNLLDNAARHGRPGGRVAVTLAGEEGAATLTVHDDGPGIPTAERGRVFERFVRGHAVRAPKSGLGLALVAQQAAFTAVGAAMTTPRSGGRA